jgi:phosphate uptake regulator
MYKVDLETLKEVTKVLDAYLNGGWIANSGSDVIRRIKLRKKAEKLSQKIKDNYTQIKK